jgi:hypothetical protein
LGCSSHPSYDALKGLRALLLEKLAEVGTRAADYRTDR